MINFSKFLKKLYESKSPLLDELVQQFSYELVFSFDPDKRYKTGIYPEADVIKKVYAIVNKWLFGNRLRPDIRIDVVPLRSGYKKSYLAAYWFAIGETVDKYDGHRIVGLFDEHGKLDNTAPWIEFTCSYEKQNLMHIVNLLAHEMIHEYDMEVGDGVMKTWNAKLNNTQYNAHGEAFRYFMDIGNNFYGMNIVTMSCGVDGDSYRSTQKARAILTPEEIKDPDYGNNDSGIIINEKENDDNFIKSDFCEITPIGRNIFQIALA